MWGTGCASYHFVAEGAAVGASGPDGDITDAAASMSEEEAEDVHILIGRLPEGMHIVEERLVVDAKRYEILGAVRAVPEGTIAANLGIWFYDYNEGEDWRDGYCAWQVPLSWLTLGLWAFVTPFHYPCKITSGQSDPRRDNILRALRRGTKALGGNLVVVTGIGDLVTVRVDTGQVVDHEQAFIGTGIAVRYLGTEDGGGWEKMRPEDAPPVPPQNPDDGLPDPETASLPGAGRRPLR